MDLPTLPHQALRTRVSGSASPAAGRWRLRFSLRTRVGAALAALVFLSAGVVGGITGQHSISQLRDQIGQSLATDAQQMAERLDTEIASRMRELTLVADLEVLRELAQASPVPLPNGVLLPSTSPGAGPAHVQGVLDGLLRSVPAYRLLAMTDAQGRVLASTDPALRGTEISTRLPLIGSAGPGAVRSGPDGALSPADDGTINLVTPIRSIDGGVLGVVVGQLNMSWIRELQRKVLSPDDQGVVRREMFLVGQRDIVLVGPGRSRGTRLVLPGIDRARAGFPGAKAQTWPDDEIYLTGSALANGPGGMSGTGGGGLQSGQGGWQGGGQGAGQPVGPATGEFAAAPGVTAPGTYDPRWVILVRQGLDEAFAPAYEQRRAILLVGLVLSLFFAVVGWLIAGWITAPMKRIAIAAERLRQGDDVELPRIRGAIEIESLSGSLRALVATLTRKQMALAEMEGLALRDPLTGLLNRNGLRTQLQLAVARARADGAGLLVFMGDLDGFKSVNDSLGHAIGDLLLRQVAARLTAAVRAEDIVARLGGDEFVLALRAPKGVMDQAARNVARRALTSIATPYDLRGQTVRVGCSLGGACWPDHADVGAGEASRDDNGLDGVLERADAALYVVKRTGKGRILFHGETVAA